MWKVYFSDFTGGIHTDLRILPVDFTGGIQGEAFVDLRWFMFVVIYRRVPLSILSYTCMYIVIYCHMKRTFMYIVIYARLKIILIPENEHPTSERDIGV